MTKEKIIDLMREQEKDGGILFFKSSSEDFANTLLTMIEQEKKEQAREMLGKITELFPTDKNFTAISRTTIKALAKDYGVEL